MPERRRRMRRETRRGKRAVVEGTLEKERRLAAGSWLAGMAEAGANEPFFIPVGRWVVERGLPRRLSVSRTSGLEHSFFFLPFVRSLSSFPGVPGLRLTPFSPVLLPRFCSVPRSTLATLLFRDLVSAVAFLFFPFRPICSPSRFLPPPLGQPRPCFAALYARAFPASPALRSDRLRIHCEIDRPKRVPEWPERARMQQKGTGWHMRSGRFKGRPQERDTTAARCIATLLNSSFFPP